MRGGSSHKGDNMRRLLRWAFNFAALVSALLFVATCVMWVRSYWAGYEVSRAVKKECVAVGSGRGVVFFERIREGFLVEFAHLGWNVYSTDWYKASWAHGGFDTKT